MLFILPTGVNYETARMPVVTFTIMGVNVVLYILDLVLYFGADVAPGGERPEWVIEHLGLIPAESVWYTWITSLFVHAGFWHLLGNMMYLFLFGCSVEDFLGRWQYAIFYLLGGLSADFLHILASAGKFDSTIPLVGASGAISACMGGFILLLHRNQIDFHYFFLFFFRVFSGEFSMPAWLVISFWFLKDLAWAILDYSAKEGGGGTAFAAHVGGFVGGMGMVSLWKWRNRGRPLPGDEPVDLPSLAGTSQLEEPADVLLYANGTQIGPFTRRQALEMLEIGSIPADTLYWREGMADWGAIDELK